MTEEKEKNEIKFETNVTSNNKKKIIILFVISILSIIGIIFIFIVCLKDDVIQVSEVTIKDNYIVGSMQNMDVNNAYEVTLYFKLKSGSLVKESCCTEIIRPLENKKFKSLEYDIDETYKVKLDKMEYKEYAIPPLTKGEISIDTLKYHFENIYHSYILDALNISEGLNYVESTYPYIDEIKYDDEKIDINTSFGIVNLHERFDTKTKKPKLFSIFITDKNQIEKIILNISLMQGFELSNYQSLILYEIMINEIPEGYCKKIGKWEVSKRESSLGTFFYITSDS